MQKTKRQIYIEDIFKNGLRYFIVSRIKKHSVTRKLWYLFRKSYVLIEGRKLFINKMDTVVSETLLSTGVWEPVVSKYFVHFAKKAKTIVDIGGNLGYFTLLASIASSRASSVTVFEPDGTNFSLLQHTVIENKLSNVRYEHSAVGKKTGRLKLFVTNQNFGDHRTYDSGDNRKYSMVNVISLDDYFIDTPDDIELIKIDIQGYEVQALLGAKKLLQQNRIKIIFSEVWPMGLQLAGNSWQEYIHLLEKSGFSLWEINEELGKITPFNKNLFEFKLNDDQVYSTNIVAVLT